MNPPGRGQAPARGPATLADVVRWLSFWLLCLGLLSGCRSPAPRSPEVVRQQAAVKATQPPEPSIFDRLTLAPGQRAVVDEARATVHRQLEDYDRARLALLDEIALEVRNGAFDKDRLDPLIEQTIIEYERAIPALVRFANELHRVLSPAQRAELVKLWDDDDEHLSEEERRAKEEEALTRVIDLTGGQRTRLVTPLLGIYLEYRGPISDLRKSWREVKAAFVEPSFDAAELRFFTELPLRPLARAAFDASETVLTVLDENQRETLAAAIETRWRD